MPELKPIPASRVAAGKVSLTNVSVHNNKVYWCESRPERKRAYGYQAISQWRNC